MSKITIEEHRRLMHDNYLSTKTNCYREFDRIVASRENKIANLKALIYFLAYGLIIETIIIIYSL